MYVCVRVCVVKTLRGVWGEDGWVCMGGSQSALFPAAIIVTAASSLVCLLMVGASSGDSAVNTGECPPPPPWPYPSILCINTFGWGVLILVGIEGQGEVSGLHGPPHGGFSEALKTKFMRALCQRHFQLSQMNGRLPQRQMSYLKCPTET